MSLDEAPDDIVRMLRDSAAAFARDGILRARAHRRTDPGFDRETWRRMADAGWCGILVPEKDGGLGAGYRALGALACELAQAVAPEPLSAVAGLAARTLCGCPAQPRRDTLMDGLIGGDLIIGTAFQSPAGSLLPLETPLTITNGRVLGEVRHVFPALGADGFLVAARDGATLVLAWVDAARATVTPELRADGSQSGRVRFDGATADVLAQGAVAEAALTDGIDAAVAVTSAELLGLMRRSLQMTLDYMRTRVQFGKPIGSFQALQHRAVDLWIQIELAQGAVDDALAALDGGGDADARRFAVGRAKSRAADSALVICRECIKLHGAIGFTDEHDIGLFLRRAITLSAWLGNGAEHRRAIAPMVELAALTREQPPEGNVHPDFLSATRTDTNWNAFDDQDFRAGVRAWLEANYPQELRHLGRRMNPAEIKEWLDCLCVKGWVAPAWPVERGGMGLSPIKQVIFIEERERIGIARTAEQGVNMLGPMLMHYGSAAQQDEYLPRIISGEHWWCQGYSEPNAGSDLASLTTEAVPEGDDYIINGSKIWTSGGHHADHMFLLARTDKTAKKQEGISFFLLDLSTPGVTVRPIRNLAGHEEFAQVFFDNVRIPKSNMVGQINRGWGVAKTLLGFERLGTGSPRRVQVPLNQLVTVAEAQGLWGTPEFQARFIPLWLDVMDLASAYGRFCEIVRTGAQPGPEISMLKIVAGEVTQKVSEFLIEIAGPAGAIRSTQQFGGVEMNTLNGYYTVFGATIASGTNDIQRNIIADRVLRLPRAR